MARAIELARRGQWTTRPNPSVGCVLVGRDGAVLGEGFHRAAGLPHAEVEALTAAHSAGRDTWGATAYVTLEPCNHHGRTGPCSEALAAAGVRRVVVAMRDPHGRAAGGVERLRQLGVRVEVGCMQREALLLNPAFITYHQLLRPLVTLKWAMTLDGCTSVASGDSKWITDEAARHEVHRQRARHDAVLAGIETVLQDEARLNVRLPMGDPEPRFPLLRIVLDSKLRIPPEAPFLQRIPGTTALVVTTPEAPEPAAQALRAAGAEVLRVEPDQGRPAIPLLLRELHRRGVQSVYVEGGRKVSGAFLAAGVVDRVATWIGPRIVGGGPRHLGPISHPTPLDAMAEAPTLHHVVSRPVGSAILIEGWLSKHLFPPE